jgi:Peptidase family M28/PDZ domain/PA domain
MDGMRIRRLLIFLPVLFTAAGLLVAADSHSNPAFTPEEVREHVRYLASDELQGRGSGTEGARKAAAYIAERFRAAGLRPRGDRGFYQRFSFAAGVRLGEPNRLSLRAGSGRGESGVRPGRSQGSPLRLRQDFLPLAFSANGRASGEVLFVGYGISEPRISHDDYAGVDARGRIVLVLRQTPEGDDPKSRFAPFAPLRYKAMTAREKGAAGILFVTGPLTETEEDLGGFRFDTSFADSGIPAAVIKRSFAEELLRPTGQSLSEIQTAIAHTGPHSLPLPGAAATLTCSVVRERRETDNVLGFLEGSDPRLREETIVIGAHYDHLGLGGEGSRSRERGPAIHHGADDNASGVAGLLELAEYFGVQRPRPRRSLLFAAFSGEELGLLGSAHYVKHPPVPLASTVAMINLDMIGRARGNALTVIGSGTSPAWKELLEAANADFKLDLRMNASGFGASDQSSFYGRDIPVLFFFTGVHKDYHMPSDTWEKINIVGEARIARFVAAVVERTAGLPERPRFARAEGEGPTMASPGFGVYLGTIPDYSEQGEGVTLSGVREGSPAEKAGLRAGDVIVQFGGKAVKNVYDYTYALRDARAGEPVEVVVLRKGERQTLSVIPEKRRS